MTHNALQFQDMELEPPIAITDKTGCIHCQPLVLIAKVAQVGKQVTPALT